MANYVACSLFCDSFSQLESTTLSTYHRKVLRILVTTGCMARPHQRLYLFAMRLSKAKAFIGENMLEWKPMHHTMG